MDISKQFNLVAQEYDADRRKFLPCFDAFYRDTTEFVVHSIAKPHRVLDLGAGTGLLTMYWYSFLSETEYVLTDVSVGMLDIAKKRFRGLEQITYDVSDYRQQFPNDNFDVIISALSIHHLEDSDKKQLFHRIYETLPEGGVFVNYDQFCGETNIATRLMDNYWFEGLMHSGLSEQSLEKWRERRKLDRECSVSNEITWLKEAGFQTVQCVYTHQKFSVLMAIKLKE